jgi:signal transduction histidine kinase
VDFCYLRQEACPGTDLRKQPESEAIKDMQHIVTQILAEAATVAEATPKILRALGECLGGDVGALWRVDQEAGVLRCAEVWHKPSKEVPEFESASRERTFHAGVGLPGKVWLSRKPRYISNLVREANFQRTPVAARERLHAAFGFPILLGGEVLGVIEFFSREIRQPDQELLATLATIGSQIGQFIERKRAEDALHRAQMELAHVTRVATLGEMAASIAHEVNQPLTAVIANANASLRWLAAATPNLDEARDALSRILRDGNRAGEVIARIRALVQKTDTEKVRLDINKTVQEIVLLMQNEAVRKGVAIRMDLAANVPPVSGDRIQLQQVILNLVMNGIEAMDTITDRPREMLIRSCEHESNQLLVAVQDSGVGIDSQNLEKIFDAFYTTKPQGMGMGLAICRSIIETHGGRLWATATKDRGATFRFTLPTGGETGAAVE